MYLCSFLLLPLLASATVKPIPPSSARDGVRRWCRHLLHVQRKTEASRENAACALVRLSQVEEHKITIDCSSAIPLLVHLLETGGSRKDASTVLFLLCSTKENKTLRPFSSLSSSLARPPSSPPSPAPTAPSPTRSATPSDLPPRFAAYPPTVADPCSAHPPHRRRPARLRRHGLPLLPPVPLARRQLPLQRQLL